MNKKIIFMFSGQGSQYYQMGKELYTNEPIFRKWMHDLDEIPKKIIGKSIVDIIYHQGKGKGEIYDQTLFTHPAIFMVEYSLAMVLVNSGIEPEYVLGTSLGEFTAAAIGGIIGVEQALELIVFQATCIENSCERGGMIAILENYELYDRVSLVSENSSVAGINFDSHFVVSGFESKLRTIEDYLKKKEIPYQSLPVSHGFHSPNIDPAEEKFTHQTIVERYDKPHIGYISSNKGIQLQEIETGYFWNIIRDPILFRETLLELMNDNCVYRLVDLSPSGTLATFARYIVNNNKNMEIMYTMTPFGNECKNLNLLRNFIND